MNQPPDNPLQIQEQAETSPFRASRKPIHQVRQPKNERWLLFTLELETQLDLFLRFPISDRAESRASTQSRAIPNYMRTVFRPN